MNENVTVKELENSCLNNMHLINRLSKAQTGKTLDEWIAGYRGGDDERERIKNALGK